MRGYNCDDNWIGLEVVNTAHLLQIIEVITPYFAKNFRFGLRNGQMGPVLRFEIEYCSREEGNRIVTHDLNVNVIKQNRQYLIAGPDCPPYNVSIKKLYFLQN